MDKRWEREFVFLQHVHFSFVSAYEPTAPSGSTQGTPDNGCMYLVSLPYIAVLL